jgi:hypothetical protein
MRCAAAALAIAAASLCAAAAQAGETRCWLDQGAVVAPAAFGDIAGDFLVDFSAARSALHLDTAQSHGLDGTQVSGALVLAGERLDARFDVVSLDERTRGLPTSIDGLIGADALAGRVVDLSFSPCRIVIWRGRPPPVRALARLPLAMTNGAPTFAASISDGRTALRGRFAIDTGTAAVRIASAAARLSRPGADAGSRLAPPARLDALGVDGLVLRGLPAALASDLPAGVLGGVGDAAWAGYDLRIDLSRMRLELSAPRPARSGDSSHRAGRRRSRGRSSPRGRSACARSSSGRRPR